MKINLFESDAVGEKIGGGFTAFRNLKKTLIELGHTVSNVDYDVSLAMAPTLVTWDQWKEASKKPRVLRADSVPENHRNRATGFSRLKGFAQESDLTIFQSDFTANTTGRLIGKKGTVIHNGVDTSVFKKEGSKLKPFGNPQLLFIHYRNDPNKRVQEVIDRFRIFKLDNPNSTMTFVGDFPKEQFRWDSKSWDFGMLDLKEGKDWRYLGIIKERDKLAEIMRSSSHFCWPSFNDSSPNVLSECLCCGCKPLWINDYGSSNEIINLYNNGYDFSLKHMAKIYIEKMGNLIK